MLRLLAVAAAVVGVQIAPAAPVTAAPEEGTPAAVPADHPPPPAPAPPPAATTGPDYFAIHHDPDKVTVRKQRGRSRNAKILLAGLAGGAVVTGALGVYFHLDSRAVAKDLSADTPQDRRWSDALASKYDRGQRDKTLATVGYVAAGGLAVGFLIALWSTDPGSDVVEIPVRGEVQPAATIVPGGATLGAELSW